MGQRCQLLWSYRCYRREIGGNYRISLLEIREMRDLVRENTRLVFGSISDALYGDVQSAYPINSDMVTYIRPLGRSDNQ